MNKNHSEIYVYVSYNSTIVNAPFILFAERCGYRVLTCETEVVYACKSKGIAVLLAPENPIKFKKFLRKISVPLFVLAGDQYHGRDNYIARNYNSIFVQGVSWNSKEFFERAALLKDNFIYLFIYKFIGLTVTLFNTEKNPYNCSIKGLLYAFKDKVIWGLRNDNYLHGGFSDLIFLQGDWEKDIYIKNLFPSSKLRVTGSIVADSILMDLDIFSKKTFNNTPSCDLLFISQPLYKYPEYQGYLNELEQVVRKCNELNIKMIIKLHPRDNIEVFERFESNKCQLIRHSKDRKNEENICLIKKAKVVMGKGSTAILIPLLIGKPVIFLDIKESPIVHFKYYIQLKFLLKDIVDFEDMYANASSSDNELKIKDHQNKILAKHGFYDGKNWQRIKNEISIFQNKLT